MHMNRKRAARVLLFAAVVFVAGKGFAQDAVRDDSTWKLLTESDDVSRGTLLERFADTLVAAEGGQAKTFAFPYTFRFAHDALIDTNNHARKGEIFGIDISHWEGSSFPFDLVKRQSVSFVYTKATQGTDFADPTFDHNWKTLGGLSDDKKIPRGAFHFLSSDPSMSGKAQADSFVDYVTGHGKFLDGDLRPALDLEWDVTCKTCQDRWQTNHRTPAEIIKTTVDFVNEVNTRTGRKTLLYTNKSFLTDNHIDSADFVRRLPATVRIWIFDVDGHDRNAELPNPANNLPFVLWQFSFGGALSSGFDGSFDVDVFKSKQTDLDPDKVLAQLTDLLVKDNDAN
jgi:lysozyme